MSRRSVVIVGAGPAGAATAIGLARAGVGDVLMLDRARFPRPKACGGGLSPNAIDILRRLDLGAQVLDCAYRVETLRFVGPGGEESILRGTPAMVMNRSEFDVTLLVEARRRGVEVWEGFRVTALARDRGRVVGVTDGHREVDADVVVVADGAHSAFSVDPRPRDGMATIMGWYDGFDVPRARMEMIFDRRLLPCYAWVFPETDDRVNIGLCHPGRSGSINLRTLFEEVLDDQFGPRIRAARRVGRLRGHPIAVTGWIDHVAAPGVLWVGEAARLVNAATGEGIYHALTSGTVAARRIAEAIAARRDPGDAGGAYAWSVRRELGIGLAAGAAFRRFLGGPGFRVLCRIGDNPLVRRVLARVLEGL